MYIVTGSVTSAVRLGKALERYTPFFARVVHTPASLSGGGCSYSLVIKEEALEAVKKIAEENGIKIKKIYLEKEVNGERAFDDISG